MSATAMAACEAALRLEPHAVDVWTVVLDQPAEMRAAHRASLSDDERGRADRFVFDRDRHHYVVCRGALRHLLAGYLDRRPADLAFSYGHRGKPALEGLAAGRLQFNVSHASGVAVVAITTGAAVGVDLECLARTVEFEALARRFFSAGEADQLLSLPDADRRAGFFACWTRKEAYIKAIGDGLACPLDSFAVTLRPDQAPAFRWIATDDAAAWTLRAFEPAPGYVAAIAARAPIARVTCRQLQGPLS
jgi:4'-phosphopantetheinyl transferase